MNAKEKLLLEIQDAPESVITKVLEIVESLKQQSDTVKDSEIINKNSSKNLEVDPLLSVIGIFDAEAISSTEIDRELYDDEG